MAKGSFLGVKRGKLGDIVGYQVTNSADKDKQGWRPYQPKVRNPQSDGQIDQRVKLLAVNNLYRALKSIIQRGWENHKYGDESRRAFLKHALGASFTGPYLVKGSTLAVPIEGVPITYGSLPPVSVSCPGGADLPVFINVLVGDGNTATIGGVSQLFINNGLAEEGDQITIVFGYISEFVDAVQYHEISFIVSTTDTRTCTDAIGITFHGEDYEGEDRLAIDSFDRFDYDSYDYCCLVSVSRNGDNANLRSYAEFAMTPTFRAKFYDNAEQNAAAKRSYRKQQSADTNWPLIPGSNIVLPVGTTRAMVNSATPAQVQVNAYRTLGGYLQVWDNTNSIWRYVYGTGPQNLSYHKWLTSTKVGDNVWSSSAPLNAQAADAIMFSTSNDATEADLEFARWLISNPGYDPISTLK